MTYENFLKVVTQLQKQDKILDNLYQNKFDLTEFVDPYHAIITILIQEIYGEEGLGWFSWYCYENDFGSKGLQAWNADKNPICYDTKSLWEYLEELKNN